jgi:antitoxin HigA-1
MVNNYGARLAEALQIARKDRQELADGIGVSVQAIGQVIAGKTKALTAENSALAARFLGVDIFWLATGAGNPKIVAKHPGQWPFSVSMESFLAIPEEEQSRIGEYIEFCVNKWQAAHPAKK